MIKKLLLTAFVLMLVSGVSGQTLQDFEYSPGNDFQLNLTGGESFSVDADFTNAVSRPVPVAVEVRVDGDLPMSSSGEEFDLSGSTVDAEGLEFSDFDYYKKNGDGFYTSTLNGSVSEDFDSGVSLVFDSSTLIQPDTYSFDVKVRSEIGSNSSASSNASVNASEPAEVSSGNARVKVNASDNANVTVQSLGSVSTQPPQSRTNFVGGVSVDVRNNTGKVEASGTVTITYSNNAFDDDDMAVYYYNDTSGEWEFEGGTHYPGNNSIVADVDHFSTYVAYRSQPDTDDDNDGGGGGGSTSSDDQAQDETTTVNEDTEPEETAPEEDSSSQGQEQNETDQAQDEEQQQQNNTETGQEDAQQPEGPQNPPRTGLFTANPTSIAGGLAFLILVLAAGLQYTGRIDFREVPEKVRSYRG
ncbi:hypothetical protein [Candidatus Nanohalovita haloferacivicina]|uniref:hypothetical protein n=1 Tax=Candidatus Nanohalovita haloferacivicina TaxID=2978046 RepID=UPI00325FCC12|nr:hypothetical protein HBNXNv_0139 [Candidatus Nanohalobia archaeon BNXNv]